MRWYGDQNKDLSSSNYILDMRLAVQRTVKVGRLSLEIKWNRLSFLKKVVNCYQLRPDIQTYGHRPRYIANVDIDAANIDVCAQKCLVAAASTILFRIIWRCVNQAFHVRRIFCPPKCWRRNVVVSSEELQHEGLLLANHGCCSHVWPEANPHAAAVHWKLQRFAVNI